MSIMLLAQAANSLANDVKVHSRMGPSRSRITIRHLLTTRADCATRSLLQGVGSGARRWRDPNDEIVNVRREHGGSLAPGRFQYNKGGIYVAGQHRERGAASPFRAFAEATSSNRRITQSISRRYRMMCRIARRVITRTRAACVRYPCTPGTPAALSVMRLSRRSDLLLGTELCGRARGPPAAPHRDADPQPFPPAGRIQVYGFRT